MTDEQYRRESDRNGKEVLDTVRKIDKNVSTMSVKLFGNSDADDENETGRLPRVEKEAREAHAKIETLTSNFSNFQKVDGPFGKVRLKIATYGGAIGLGAVVLHLLVEYFVGKGM